jgi:hypothetical protein
VVTTVTRRAVLGNDGRGRCESVTPGRLGKASTWAELRQWRLLCCLAKVVRTGEVPAHARGCRCRSLWRCGRSQCRHSGGVEGVEAPELVCKSLCVCLATSELTAKRHSSAEAEAPNAWVPVSMPWLLPYVAEAPNAWVCMPWLLPYVVAAQEQARCGANGARIQGEPQLRPQTTRRTPNVVS